MPAGQRSLIGHGSQAFLRALAVWLVFITVESILGTLRVLFLEPRIGAEVGAADWVDHRVSGAAYRHLSVDRMDARGRTSSAPWSRCAMGGANFFF